MQTTHQIAAEVRSGRSSAEQVMRETIGRITRWRMSPTLAGSINAVGMLAVLAYVVVMIVVQIRAP